MSARPRSFVQRKVLEALEVAGKRGSKAPKLVSFVADLLTLHRDTVAASVRVLLDMGEVVLGDNMRLVLPKHAKPTGGARGA